MIDQFREFLAGLGVCAPDGFVTGKIVRCPAPGKGDRNTSFWFVLREDGSAFYGNWATQERSFWRADLSGLSQEQRDALAVRTEAAQSEEAAARFDLECLAVKRANKMWLSARPSDGKHAYLRRKGIQAHGTREIGADLVVPMMTGTEVHGLQFISEDGFKSNLPHAPIKGRHYALGENLMQSRPKQLVVAEGFATAASIRQATGLPCVCIFGTGNAIAAGKVLARDLPGVEFIWSFDPDEAGDIATEKAVKAFGGLVVRI